MHAKGSFGAGQHGRVPDSGVVPPGLLQNGPCHGGDRRPVLVPGLLMLAPPPDRPGIKVDVGPPDWR